MATFLELAGARKKLQDFCHNHYSSLWYFHQGISFFIDDADRKKRTLGDNEAAHLTSTATCYGSLADCAVRFDSKHYEIVLKYANRFAEAALQRSEWLSDGSAPIYCRARTLPFVINNVNNWSGLIADRLEEVLKQLTDDPGRLGIGEEEVGDPSKNEKQQEPKLYPPNAYHTYWTVVALDELQKRFPGIRQSVPQRGTLQPVRKNLMNAAQRIAGYQIALHSTEAEKRFDARLRPTGLVISDRAERPSDLPIKSCTAGFY